MLADAQRPPQHNSLQALPAAVQWVDTHVIVPCNNPSKCPGKALVLEWLAVTRIVALAMVVHHQHRKLASSLHINCAASNLMAATVA